MSRISRVVVLATALLATAAALASTAGAVTWHNSGDTAFTASGQASTYSVTGVSLVCSGATMTATSPSAAFVGATYGLATGTFTRTGCSLSGISTFITCSFKMTATAQDAAVRTVTTGSFDVSCSMTQSGAEICKIEGTQPATYVAPTAPSQSGQFILPHSSSLRTTDGNAGSCFLGTGEPLTWTTETFSLTSATGGATSPHLGPVIQRTA
jgi:hypothetical protein